MKLLSEICSFFNDLLKIDEVPDDSVNGLQIEGTENVKKIAFMVNCSQEGVNKAASENAQMIVCHHGMIWGGLKTITGINYKRVKAFIDSDISLYTAHLPLDVHPEFGHGVCLLKHLGFSVDGCFGKHGKYFAGAYSDLEKPLSAENLVSEIGSALNVPVRSLLFGKREVSRIGVVSGSGVSLLEEAVARGVDLFITGESKLSAFDMARELLVNVIFAGHYATETLGLKALMEHAENILGVETCFIDIPTEL